MIDFTVPYLVVAKQGDRSRIVTTGSGKQFVHHYQPSKVKRNANELALLCSQHRPEKPLEGALWVQLIVTYPWLKSHSAKVRANGKRPKETKPDVDNIAKQVLDTLQSIGFFRNDSQISELYISKDYDDSPSLRVMMGALP